MISSLGQASAKARMDITKARFAPSSSPAGCHDAVSSASLTRPEIAGLLGRMSLRCLALSVWVLSVLALAGCGGRRAVVRDLPLQPTLAGADTAMCVARREGSEVYCWGANPGGRTSGVGAVSDRPVRVEGLPSGDGVVQLAIGSTATCGLLQSGRVLCWGGNQYGELGNFTRKDSRRPVYVQGLARAARLVAVEQTFCALTPDGRVFCWGAPKPLDGIQGRNAPLGAWSFGAPNLVGDLTPPVLDLTLDATGGGCVVRGQGEVWCWGAATGFGGRPLDGRLARVPTAGPAARVSLGPRAAQTTMITADDGGLWCLGPTSPPTFAQGRLLPFDTGAAPQRVPDTGPVEALVEGASGHRCVLRRDGTVRCWGNCKNRVCAAPPGSAFPKPDLRGYFSPPTWDEVKQCRRLCFGDLRNTPDAATRCELLCSFGLGYLDRLEASERAGDVVSPSPIPGLNARFVSIATQQGGACGVDAAGQVTCWGPPLVKGMRADGRPHPLPGLK
jgi:hypothetical protein